jgi:hypothetical protein
LGLSQQIVDDPCDPGQGTGGFTGGVVEDFTDQPGCTRFEETDIYAKAVNVSDRRVVEDPAPMAPTYQQRVLRRVEVPYTRKVKVPVRTKKIVEGTIRQKVPTKRLVEVPVKQLVEEEYTEFEEREAIREKEIWVKKIVPEKYIERVPVKKVRQVEKMGTEMREIEEWVEMDVPTSRVVEVDGYRVDDVEDTKMVEVEEVQEMEAVWQPRGDACVTRTRELGRVPGSHLARSQGQVVHDPNAEGLEQLDQDSNPEGSLSGTQPVPVRSSSQRGLYAGGGGERPNSFYRASADYRPNSRDPNDVFSAETYTDPRFIRAAGDFHSTAGHNLPQQSRPGSLGLSVKNTHTRHTNGSGCQITKIDHGGAAARAGLLQNDIITAVNGQPTNTVHEFARAVGNVSGPVVVTANRDGRRNVVFTIAR